MVHNDGEGKTKPWYMSNDIDDGKSKQSRQTAATHVQNAVVESTSIVGTIDAMNLRNTTR